MRLLSISIIFLAGAIFLTGAGNDKDFQVIASLVMVISAILFCFEYFLDIKNWHQKKKGDSCSS